MEEANLALSRHTVQWLEPYARGNISQPSKIFNADKYKIWKYNDQCTLKAIATRIKGHLKYIINNTDTAVEMWKNLEEVCQPSSDEIMQDLIRKLHNLKAEEGDDIAKHLKTIQQIWDRVIQITPEVDLQFNNKTMKLYLADTLPRSWDQYTQHLWRDAATRDISVHM